MKTVAGAAHAVLKPGREDLARGAADLGQLVLAHFHELFGLEAGLLKEATA